MLSVALRFVLTALWPDDKHLCVCVCVRVWMCVCLINRLTQCFTAPSGPIASVHRAGTSRFILKINWLHAALLSDFLSGWFCSVLIAVVRAEQ